MNPEGRFVVRPTQDGKGDLIVGSMYRCQKLIKPGVVYQINNILDTLVIKELGTSVMGQVAIPSNQTGIGVGWLNDVNSILSFADKHWILTRHEYLLERLPVDG